jgi:hypothetical protein
MPLSTPFISTYNYSLAIILVSLGLLILKAYCVPKRLFLSPSRTMPLTNTTKVDYSFGAEDLQLEPMDMFRSVEVGIRSVKLAVTTVGIKKDSNKTKLIDWITCTCSPSNASVKTV